MDLSVATSAFLFIASEEENFGDRICMDKSEFLAVTYYNNPELEDINRQIEISKARMKELWKLHGVVNQEIMEISQKFAG